MRKLFLFAIAFSFSLSTLVACDCETIPISVQSIASSELIFLGKVVAISGCDKTSKASFSIQELFRGKAFANIEIEFDCTSDCQMSFSPGQTWIIYAKYKTYGKAEVFFCGYSRQQFANEKDDYNSVAQGMNFDDEKKWLENNVGVQTLNEKNPMADDLHENIHPNGYQILYYLGFGFVGLIVIYFVGRKYLK